MVSLLALRPHKKSSYAMTRTPKINTAESAMQEIARKVPMHTYLTYENRMQDLGLGTRLNFHLNTEPRGR